MIPVIQALAGRVDVPISVDTTKPEVARLALEAGASIINDIRGLDDPEMLALAAETGAGRRPDAHARHAPDHADRPPI